MYGKPVPIRFSDAERAAMDRARGDVPLAVWIRRTLAAALEQPTGQSTVKSPAPVRQVSAPRTAAPSSPPPVDDRRAAARAALSTVPRRMVPSQRAAEQGETVLDYADAQG